MTMLMPSGTEGDPLSPALLPHVVTGVYVLLVLLYGSQKVKIQLKVKAEYEVPKAPTTEGEGEEGKKKEAPSETNTILKTIEEEKEKAMYR